MFLSHIFQPFERLKFEVQLILLLQVDIEKLIFGLVDVVILKQTLVLQHQDGFLHKESTWPSTKSEKSCPTFRFFLLINIYNLLIEPVNLNSIRYYQNNNLNSKLMAQVEYGKFEYVNGSIYEGQWTYADGERIKQGQGEL